MFPYHDENETQRTAVITVAIIAACVVAWVVVQGAGATVPVAASVCKPPIWATACITAVAAASVAPSTRTLSTI